MKLGRGGILELQSGGSVWYRVQGQDVEAALRERFSAALREELRGGAITAVGTAADGTAYVGASDGRIWRSIKGAQFEVTRAASGSRVERIFVNPTNSGVALAALSGKGPHVLRTTNFQQLLGRVGLEPPRGCLSPCRDCGLAGGRSVRGHRQGSLLGADGSRKCCSA